MYCQTFILSGSKFQRNCLKPNHFTDEKLANLATFVIILVAIIFFHSLWRPKQSQLGALQHCYKLVIQSHTSLPTTEITFEIHSVAWKRFANSFQNSIILSLHGLYMPACTLCLLCFKTITVSVMKNSILTFTYV